MSKYYYYYLLPPTFWNIIVITTLNILKFMRLIHEHNLLINDVLNSYEWLPLVNFSHQVFLDNLILTLPALLDNSNIKYLELFNVISTQFVSAPTLIDTALTSDNPTVALTQLDFFNSWLFQFFVQPANIACSTVDTFALNFHLNLDWSLANLLVLLYLVILLWKCTIDTVAYTAKYWFNLTQVLHMWLYSWVFGGIDKVESTEEILCLVILWPWCFLIIFTHMYSIANYDYTFGFAEWGLPVTYGLIMLIEHWWAFGAYLFIYITNTKGRRSLIITIFEDIISMVILIARVLLQAVRGVIVGMFHFICREAIWNMTAWWTHNNHANSSTALANETVTSLHPNLGLLFDILLTGSSFVIITAIMFLQLIFLIVSVWLFCKCWFISWNKDKINLNVTTTT